MMNRVLFIFFSILMSSSLYAAEPVSIGVVLPLSGRFAAFGNKALQGAELAIEKYSASDAGKKMPVRLLIKDSQGLPDVAEKAVMELDKEGVSTIIGPILGVTADSSAKKAQELGIPIITMTQKGGVTDIGEWAFRNCMTNTAQVKELVKYLSKEGIKRVAVLYPDNTYGNEMRALFTSELEGAGGMVAASQGYKEGQTDFGKEIKALVGPEFLKNMKTYMEIKEREFKEAERSGAESRKEQKEEIERPRPEFDAVFIPDYAERVGLIVPQLAFYDVTGVRLLGTSGWNSPSLLRLASDYLEDAVFVDGFFSGSERPHVREFVELYRNSFGEEPGILEAQAFDTAGMALSIISGGVGTREVMRDMVLGIKDYQGVTGVISFRGRDAERTLYLLTVRKGRIEEIPAR